MSRTADEGESCKRCPDCGRERALSAFGRNASRPDGLSFYCLECFRARNNALYRARRERAGATVREPYTGPEDHKRCSACREVKPLADFHRAPHQSGGYNCYCKDCRRRQNRETHLRRTYGITLEAYDAMLAAQGGVCACCGERAPQHVDHDHVTGVVRGVVCFPCNSGIGQFDDRTDLMRNAIAYLERTTCQRKRTASGVYQLTSPRPVAAASPSSSGLQHLISSRRG